MKILWVDTLVYDVFFNNKLWRNIRGIFDQLSVLQLQRNACATKLKRSRRIGQWEREFVRSYNFQFTKRSPRQFHTRHDICVEQLRANVQVKTAELSRLREYGNRFRRKTMLFVRKCIPRNIWETRKTSGQKLSDSKSFYALLLRRNFWVTIINELAAPVGAVYFFAKASEVCD